MDDDLEPLDRHALLAEAKKLRAGIRAHRDASGHDLCWHHPALWGLLPEHSDPLPAVPTWPEFLRGCVRYRESLDDQLPNAPRTGEAATFDTPDLLTLETACWRALAAPPEDARARLAPLLTADVVMVFPGGLRLVGRDTVLASIASQPWSSFRIDEPHLYPLSRTAAAIVYRASAQRGDAAPYRAEVASVYRLDGGAWQLALHQHSPG